MIARDVIRQLRSPCGRYIAQIDVPSSDFLPGDICILKVVRAADGKPATELRGRVVKVFEIGHELDENGMCRFLAEALVHSRENGFVTALATHNGDRWVAWTV